MSKLVVVAKVVAKNEFRENVKNELLKLIPPTRLESGCIDYTLHQDNEDPSTFIFYETWENLATLEQHLETDHYKSHAKAVHGMIADKAVYKMTRIE
ncbi:MAG: putative quinol monooxygenase [Chlorobium sp.]|jgi:quinol monooxygenase YgiN|nr:MAG: antibiotic biosynthesis monooxygenase [Chlorobium sp.]